MRHLLNQSCRVIVGAILSIAISGCMLFIVGIGTEGFIDYTGWVLKTEKHLSEMNASVVPRTSGYYRKVDSRGGFPNVFYLTNDGYFVFAAPMTFVNEEKHDWNLEWGRFLIHGDSLEIQFFRDTNLGRVSNRILWRYDYAVRSGHGIVTSDTILTLYGETSWCFVGCEPGKRDDSYNPPLIYRFTPTDTLPPSDNWIKHLNYAEKKLW